MALFRVGALPDGALDAAAEFYSRVLPQVLALFSPLLFKGGTEGGALLKASRFDDSPHPSIPSPEGEEKINMVLLFDSADHSHRGWRLAAVQQLARDHAPSRVNGVESDDDAAFSAAHAYLENAPGLTGQLLTLDSNGANALLSPST